MIDDKPCPRCNCLDRTDESTSDREVCRACGLVYFVRHWYSLESGKEFDYEAESDARINGWSALRQMQAAARRPDPGASAPRAAFFAPSLERRTHLSTLRLNGLQIEPACDTLLVCRKICGYY